MNGRANKPNKEETIFHAALQLAPDQRSAYLALACEGDEPLRGRIESLLQAGTQADPFFEKEPLAVALGGEPEPQPPSLAGAVSAMDRAAAECHASPEQPGDVIGRYKLLQQLGEGGCGVVYMAQQEEPVRRKVALKVIKSGMDTREVIARFEAERQALAIMDHPNIARVLDGGATAAGRPYFVMELVPGIRLTDYCDRNSLNTRERLELFMKVCHAVQHAHQKGIIHRDLKPSNILVTLHDGVPVPKVIDFGIAKATDQKLTDKTLFTELGALMGTPAYMSPEQAELSGLDIDTRTDIYSLGVLLYQLLTGKPPFDPKELLAAGLDEMRRTIREKEPPRPSTRLTALSGEDLATLAQRRGTEAPKLAHLIRGDLDWIVMKCLEKDRTRRYETANGLAADLQRHLGNEPVMARPPSTAYRFQKMVRRNKAAFTTGTAVAAALLIGLVVSTWQAIRATRAEREQSSLRQQAEFAQSNEVQLRLHAEILQTNEARLRRRTQTEKAKAEEVAEFFKRILRGVRPEVAKSRDTTVLRELLEQTVVRMHRELTNQPEVQVEVARSLAHSYERLGDYRRAEDIYRQVLPWAEAAFGRTNLFVSQVILDIPIEILNAGDQDPSRLAEAESLTSECLATSVMHFGSNHCDQISILNVLAGIQKRRGDTAGAEATLRDALSIVRQDPGQHEGHAVETLVKLAERVMVRGDYAEATALMEEALPWMRKVHGPTNVHVAVALDNLGQIAQLSHDYRRALGLREECLAMNRAVFGNASREVARSLPNVGWTAHWLGDFARAERAFRERLVLCRKMYGDFHPETASALDGLVRVLAIRPPSDEILALLREMTAIERKAWATNQTRLGLALSGDAELLIALGRFPEAESMAREALQHLEQGTDARAEDILAGKTVLGWALAERAWSERKTTAGTGLKALEPTQRVREAEQLLQDALAARLRGPKPNHWHTSEYRGRLGGALVTRAATDPALSPQARMDYLAKAETLLLESHAALQQAQEVEAMFKRAAWQRLARLYETWQELAPNNSNAEKAAEWRQKLINFEQTATKATAAVEP